MATEYERWLQSGDKESNTGLFANARNLLRRRNTGHARVQRDTNNGAVANPIKGTRVGGSTNIDGGAL